MDHISRPLTKRPRAPLACNACRQTKSKCNGDRPTCERCAKNSTECIYTSSGRDKRMDRQEERKINMALRSRIKDLETRLAAAELEGAARKKAEAEGTTPSEGGWGAAQTQSTPESTADVIATGVFDRTPIRDIGYFGPSSNHAFFWSLSTSIDNVRQRSRDAPPTQPFQPHGTSPQAPAPPTVSIESVLTPSSTPSRATRPTANQHAIARLAAATTEGAREADDAFPPREKARSWTSRFFKTIGTALPYVGEVEVWRNLAQVIDGGLAWSAVDAAAQALMSIVFAQVLHTLDDRSPEPFYRRTLALLDDKTLHVPTVDSLQALLLLASFQQNTQRSMESWAPHYLSVRISYQLGIHAPASYEALCPRDRELRSQLWFAVVNQDRILTAGLARPSLIPEQHVRMELMELMTPSRQGNDDLLKINYFRQAILVHQVLGLTVDYMYSSNINSSSRLNLGQIVSKTVDLTSRLEQWNADVPQPLVVFCTAGAANLDSMPTDSSLWERFSLLLTFFHFRAKMLIHGSLLMRLLERVTASGEEASAGVLQDAGLSLLSNYLAVLRQWLQLINGVLKHRRHFLRCNAVWWTSNYMMVSTCIHSFAFWLLSANLASSMSVLGMHCIDIETLLTYSLDTLRTLGGTSVMSRKAHRCLQVYLQRLKPIIYVGEKQSPSQGSLPPTAPDMEWTTQTPVMGDVMQHEFSTEIIASCIDDMFGSLNPNDFINTGFVGLGLGISDFDASGFI